MLDESVKANDILESGLLHELTASARSKKKFFFSCII